eukprot:10645554-Lingulodinium_polyedra.AAC.1
MARAGVARAADAVSAATAARSHLAVPVWHGCFCSWPRGRCNVVSGRVCLARSFLARLRRSSGEGT